MAAEQTQDVERWGPWSHHIRLIHGAPTRDEFGTLDLGAPLPQHWRPEDERDPRCGRCPDALVWLAMVVLSAVVGFLFALSLDDPPRSAPSPDISPTVTVDTTQPRWSE
jgi:hypothetical protein